MGVQVQRRLFTVEEYHRMAEAGILSEEDRVELIEGELVTMSPIGSRHAACVKRLVRLLDRAAGDRAIVGAQDPIRLGARSEPQPDVALLRYRPDFYASAHPGPEDVLLVVEVAETSADADRSLKIPPLRPLRHPRSLAGGPAGRTHRDLPPPHPPGLPIPPHRPPG
jgi:Uma2 family endonuclease